MDDPKAMVFDIGNVLLGWEPERFFAARIGEERAQQLFAAVPLADMNVEIDRGADFDQTLSAMALMHPEWANEIHAWHDHWLEMLGPVLTEGVALLEAVKAKGTPLFALSNFGEKTWRLAQAAHPFLHLFDQPFISAHYRLIKPDPAFYAVLERETGFHGSEIFFVDDRADNVAAAQARGWHVCHLTGPARYAQLGADLRRFGLIDTGIT